MSSRRACFVAIAIASSCGGSREKARNGSSPSSSEAGEVRIEYVPIAISWVKRHIHPGPAADAAARDAARRLGDDMLSRMQSSSEPLDSIADAVIAKSLGAAAISDPKRRKAVTLSAASASDADLPPDAREALAAFARKAHPGDVVDSPLGSGPVLVVARAVR